MRLLPGRRYDPPRPAEPAPPMPPVAALLVRLAATITAGAPPMRAVSLFPGPEVDVWVASVDDLCVWGSVLGLDRPHRTRQMPTGRLLVEARGRVGPVLVRVRAYTRRDALAGER